MSRQNAIVVVLACLFAISLLMGVAQAEETDRANAVVNDVSPSPSPSAIPSATPEASAVIIPTPTPSPAATVLVQGAVISISEQPVGFLNARLIQVRERSGTTSLYVTSSTEIIDPQGNQITISALRSGDVVQASGKAQEGGVMAERISLMRAAVASPSPTPSATTILEPV